jgi:hypothetical protein
LSYRFFIITQNETKFNSSLMAISSSSLAYISGGFLVKFRFHPIYTDFAYFGEKKITVKSSAQKLK